MADNREGERGRWAYTRLRGLLRALLVGDGRVVIVRRAVEYLCGLVLLLHGLVERMLGLVHCLCAYASIGELDEYLVCGE